MKAYKLVILTAAIWFFAIVSVSANMNQIKAYKEAFPDEKPKCTFCHMDAIPKKDAGRHELNAYGKKAKAARATPIAETYKSLGTVESNQDVKAKK